MITTARVSSYRCLARSDVEDHHSTASTQKQRGHGSNKTKKMGFVNLRVDLKQLEAKLLQLIPLRGIAIHFISG